jgi:hypothetical protein
VTSSAPFSFVRAIAAVSGVYDTAVGLFLLVAAERFAALFGVAPARPPIFSDLNALFLLAVGIGYYWPYRDPRGARWYLWVMGPGLKGAGAVAFLADYLLRHSPASFLLFAASDGMLAVLTLIALLRPTPQLRNPQHPINAQRPTSKTPK